MESSITDRQKKCYLKGSYASENSLSFFSPVIRIGILKDIQKYKYKYLFGYTLYVYSWILKGKQERCKSMCKCVFICLLFIFTYLYTRWVNKIVLVYYISSKIFLSVSKDLAKSWTDIRSALQWSYLKVRRMFFGEVALPFKE